MLAEAFGLVDGKVVAGVTVLRDLQAGKVYDVEWVKSGREIDGPDGRYFLRVEERNSMGELTSRERQRREQEQRRMRQPVRTWTEVEKGS
jgi:hypothetical protein